MYWHAYAYTQSYRHRLIGLYIYIQLWMHTSISCICINKHSVKHEHLTLAGVPTPHHVQHRAQYIRDTMQPFFATAFIKFRCEPNNTSQMYVAAAPPLHIHGTRQHPQKRFDVWTQRRIPEIFCVPHIQQPLPSAPTPMRRAFLQRSLQGQKLKPTAI